MELIWTNPIESGGDMGRSANQMPIGFPQIPPEQKKFVDYGI